MPRSPPGWSARHGTFTLLFLFFSCNSALVLI